MGAEDRMLTIIHILCSGNKAEFSRQIGIKAQTLNNWIKRGLSKEAYEKIHERWPEVNMNWLLTGEGEMLIRQENGAVRRINYFEEREKAVPVRFFSVSPSATFQEFYADSDGEVDFINVIPLDDESLDDSYCVFEVHGDSMAPQILSHSRVLCKEIRPTRWHSICDAVVAIAYADRFVIKRIIQNRLESSNYLILASDNPAFPARETVQRSDIRCIFLASRLISQKIL